MPWAFTFTLVEFTTVLLRSKKRSQRVEVPARRRCEEGRKERSDAACTQGVPLIDDRQILRSTDSPIGGFSDRRILRSTDSPISRLEWRDL
jgi:hypothetical protein